MRRKAVMALAGLVMALMLIPMKQGSVYASEAQALAMPRAGTVTASVTYRNPGAAWSHDLSLVTPREVLVCESCRGGESVSLGSLASGDALEFVLGVDDGYQIRTYSSSDSERATVSSVVNGWDIAWEDGGGPPADLVLAVRIIAAEEERLTLDAVHGGAAIAVPARPGPGGRYCTAGFPVHKNGQRYMTTAGHCRDGHAHVAVYPYNKDDYEPWATWLDCSGQDRSCIVPAPGAKPNDLMAWLPDRAQVSNLVHTGDGLQPLLHVVDWKPQMTVCRWGRTTGQEVCGKVKRWHQQTGYVFMDGPLAKEGDSGGPVYTKVTDARGEVVGVGAVGLTEAYYGDSSFVDNLFYPRGTYFMPIRTVERLLGATVAVSPTARF